MWWILLAAIIFGIIGIILDFGGAIEHDEQAEKVGSVSLLISLLLLVLIVFAFCRVEKEPWERAEEPYVTHSIVALSDGNEINGKFYCRSGYINEEFTYVYGYKTAGGGMKIQKVTDDKSTVYFRDDIEPCAKWYRWTRKFWWVKEEKTTCDIYVPTDSLEASITIDLE